MKGTPSRIDRELGVIYALWLRDMFRLRSERTRWLGVVLQPALFWLLIGTGMGDLFQFQGAEGWDYRSYFFPGILIMIVLFTTIFATISVIEDRQSGFLQGVLVSPTSRFALVMGKTAAVTTIVLIQAALFLLISPFAGFQFGDINWFYLVVALVLTSCALTFINLSMAWIMDSVAAYHAVMSMVTLPLWFVSGAMYPAPETGWLAVVMKFNPMTYMVRGTRLAMDGPGVEGMSYGVAPTLLVLLLVTLVSAAFAVRVCQR